MVQYLVRGKCQSALKHSFKVGLMSGLLVSGVIASFHVLAASSNFSNHSVSTYSSSNGTVRSPYPASYYRQEQNESSLVPVGTARTGSRVVVGGTVVPVKEVTLTAQTPGRVEYISGIEGDWFAEGEIIVAIDDDDVLAKRRQAIAELYGSASALNDTQAQYSREFWAPQAFNKQGGGGAPSMGYFPSMFERFFGGGGGNSDPYSNSINPWVIRDVDLYSRGSNISQAQSRYYGIKSRIDEIDSYLRDTRSISPFDGVIVSKLVEAGDVVQPGTPLVKFADTRYLQIKVDVPARLVSTLTPDMVVPARLDIGNTYVNIKVAQIYPTANSQRHTVPVKFDLPSGVPGGPGMYAEVMIPDNTTQQRDFPVIPKSAILWRGSLPAVYVMNSNNESELRLIRLGDDVDQQNITVLSGVFPGEQVFSNPSPRMKSGWSPAQKTNRMGGAH